MLQKGSTFMTRAVYDDKEHLSVLVTDATDPPPRYLMLNFTTLRPQFKNPDLTCTVDVGVHPNIIDPSMVSYQHADIVFENQLNERIQAGKLREVEPISEAILQDMLSGVRQSDRTKPFVKTFLDELGV